MASAMDDNNICSLAFTLDENNICLPTTHTHTQSLAISAEQSLFGHFHANASASAIYLFVVLHRHRYSCYDMHTAYHVTQIQNCALSSVFTFATTKKLGALVFPEATNQFSSWKWKNRSQKKKLVSF